MTDQVNEQTEPFELDAVMNLACREAGLSDYGDDHFVEPLTKWLNSLNTEAHLSAAGFAGTAATVNRFLVNRLRMAGAVKRHPEILEEDVSDPVVIVGLPRSGTTKLHRMIASDPSMQKPDLWRVINPAPLGVWPQNPDPRVAFAEGYVDAISSQFPELLAAHLFAAREAEEEVHLMEMGFESFGNFARWRVPTYQRWLMTRSQAPTYQLLRRFLQYLQWQDGGRRNRPWALKSPAHLGNLDILLETFPNATVVQTHRSIETTIPSLLRLLELTRYLFSDDVDPIEHGEVTLRYWAEEMAKNIDYRRVPDARIIDVEYEEIRTDPFAVIERIYARRGEQMTPLARQAMTRWAADNPQHRFGVHRYSLATYGLTPHVVTAMFANSRGSPSTNPAR